MPEGSFLGDREHDETKMIWAFCASVADIYEVNRLFYGRVEGNMRAEGYANMIDLMNAELPKEEWKITMLDFGPDYPR